MATRMDTYIPDYALSVPVANGQLWIGAFIPLYNAAGISAQVVMQNGGAGTLYTNPTNFQNTQLLSAQNIGMGYPTQGTNAAVAANSTNASIVLLPTNSATYLNGIYLTFLASAAGILNISVNVRRYGA